MEKSPKIKSTGSLIKKGTKLIGNTGIKSPLIVTRTIPEKKQYWAIFEGDNQISGGTFTQCWDKFVKKYAKKTVNELVIKNIRIGRTS